MRTVYLHIGMHKTGTSSIQSSLAGALRKGNILYADMTPYENHSVAVFTLFAKRPERHHIHRRRQFTAEQVREERERLKKGLKDDLEAHPDADFIISGEGIVALEREALSRLKDFLDAYFDQTIVCAYVRSPVAYMESTLQEGIKNGWSSFELSRIYPGYRNRFEKFDEVFGRDNVRLWEFDAGGFPDGDVVRDFCARVGITREVRSKRANESLSRMAAALLFQYWKYGPGYGAGRENVMASQRLARFVQGIGGERLRLCPEVVQDILAGHADDIAWMESRLGSRLVDAAGGEGRCVAGESDLLTLSPEETAAMLDLVKGALSREAGRKRWFR